MVRIAGVDVPDRKRAHVALRSIYGIGPKIAEEILIKANLDPVIPPRMNELSEEQIDLIRELVDRDYISEGDLRREVSQNIRRAPPGWILLCLALPLCVPSIGTDDSDHALALNHAAVIAPGFNRC